MEVSPLPPNFAWRKILYTVAWVIPLLIGLDFAFGWVGDHISRSLYRGDMTLPVVLADNNRKIDMLVVGGCRAALHIDPQILGKGLGDVQVFNAGKVVEGLGNVEFTLGIGLTHHIPKVVVIVLDDGNLQETFSQDAAEAADKLPWLPLMSRDRRAQYETVYAPPLLSRVSGVWRYRGQGRYLAASALKAVRNKPLPAVDGYLPRPAEQNVLAAIKSDENALLRNMLKTQTLSPHADAVVARLVASVKARGAKPVLVMVPMHRLRATDGVNDKQFEILSQIARKNGVSALFYPDNKSRFAHADILWSDQGHMNRLGAEEFSRILAADLSRLLAKPGGNGVVLRAGSEI